MNPNREQLREAIQDTVGLPATDAEACAGVVWAMVDRWLRNACGDEFRDQTTRTTA